LTAQRSGSDSLSLTCFVDQNWLEERCYQLAGNSAINSPCREGAAGKALAREEARGCCCSKSHWAEAYCKSTEGWDCTGSGGREVKDNSLKLEEPCSWEEAYLVGSSLEELSSTSLTKGT